MIDFIQFLAHISFNLALSDQAAQLITAILVLSVLPIGYGLYRLEKYLKNHHSQRIAKLPKPQYINPDKGRWTAAECAMYDIPYGTPRGAMSGNIVETHRKNL